MSGAPLLLGIDTGGTFTDFVLVDGTNLRVHKVLSTPHAPEQAILQGIRALGIDLARAAARLTIVHGSTVATNAVLEGKGVRTAYVTNRGFGDVLTLGRQARAELYNLQPQPVPPPVSDELIVEVNARMDAHGNELVPLTNTELERVRARLAALAPEAVAINLLFSWRNDAHERAVAGMLDVPFVTCSSEVLPEAGEYERGIATWLNAWVGPLMQRYLRRLAQAVAPARVSVMQSSGGTVAAEQAGRYAVRLLLSGPAGGVAGARYVARAAGIERILAFDMGGTSTDVTLLDGEPQLTSHGRIGRYPVAVPMLDVHTIGAGGGSIAYVDAGGMLCVGPASAGAHPGPACYGRGGTQPTVSDAHAVLGRLPAEAFLGGAMPLDIAAARAAFTPLAQRLGISIEDAAAGVVRVANEHMTRALRVVSVERGIDPRDFTLLSFGGAGGLHVCELAEALGMRRALVPAHAGVLSALGMLVAPRSRELTCGVARSLRALSDAEVADMYEALIARGRKELLGEGVGTAQLSIECSADLRYLGQSGALRLPWRGRGETEEAFHVAHERRHGHRLDHAVELVCLRVRVYGPVTPVPLASPAGATRGPHHAAVYGAGDRVELWSRAALGVDDTIAGPALIVETVATTFVATGWRARIDATGSMLLQRA